MAATASLLKMTAMSVDRLRALFLGLRYRQVVTLKRKYLTVTIFWVFVVTSMYFLDYQIMSRYGKIRISLCLLTSLFSYGRIFFLLRYNLTRVQNHFVQGKPSRKIPLNLARYRKTVSSALWVQLALGVGYLQYGILLVLNTQKKLTASLLLSRESTATLVYLNSSVNPILYRWKIREVRKAAKDTMR